MGLSHSPRIVTDGLVLCLDAANIKSYPGSGNSWIDLTTKRSIGTANNAVFDSNNGGSIVFNGTSDSVGFASDPTLRFQSNPFTLEFFINAPITGANSRMIVIGGTGTSDLQFQSSIFYDGRIRLATSTTGTTITINITSNAKIEPNTWTHIVITKTGTTANFFTNGNFVNSNVTDNTLFASNGLIKIGSTTTFTNFFEGKMAVARVYNRALSTAEIVQNFNALRGRFGI